MKFSVSSNKLLYYPLQVNKNIMKEVLGVLRAYYQKQFLAQDVMKYKQKWHINHASCLLLVAINYYNIVYQ